MADNFTSSGVTAASDDVAGIHYQRVKLDVGGDGVSLPLSDANSLPTHDADTATTGNITVTDSVVAAPAGDGTLRSGASTAGSLVALASPGGDASWSVEVSGTFTGTLYFESSLSSTTGTDGMWTNVNGRRTGVVNTELAGSATTAGVYRGNASAMGYFRVRAVGAFTGTAAIRIRISSGAGAVFLNASTPAGTNTMGAVYLGTNVGKTQAGKIGTLVSTAVTANQVVTGASHTVAAGKVGYVAGASLSVRLTTFAATATYFGTASLRIGGTAVGTWAMAGSGIYLLPELGFIEPLFANAAQVVEWVVTPAATTSYTWNGNIFIYER